MTRQIVSQFPAAKIGGEGADLSGALLAEANLRHADLRQATLVYGVRQAEDAVYIDELERRLEQVAVWSSRSPGGFQGRVTDWLRQPACVLRPHATFYLCGNGHMVDDVVGLLQERGVASNRIVTEHFFE